MAHTAHLTPPEQPPAGSASGGGGAGAPAPNAHDMLPNAQLEADAASDSHLSIDWDTLPILQQLIEIFNAWPLALRHRYLTMLGRLFSKLLWAPHQGSADSIFGVVDDHDLGGAAAGFAETNPDTAFGEIWDRTLFLLLPIFPMQRFLLPHISLIDYR